LGVEPLTINEQPPTNNYVRSAPLPTADRRLPDSPANCQPPTEYNAPVLIEAESIPYEPALLRGERLLVLAPHPDDEVIGCGGLVAQHLREHRRVRIVVATDGAGAGTAETREAETRRGVATLGGAEIEFLRFVDRGLSEDAAPRLREELLAFRPDLILVPSPIEIHPDHLVLARVFCELIQRDETLFADLATARVAFYEVGQPLRPNAIVDISDVADLKYAAIAEHVSQLTVRDYVAYARGLNAYRAMTLPAGTTFAEAYHVIALPSLRTMPFSQVRREVGAPRDLEVIRETLPISVVIRTKDRPALLREAIESVRANGYPCEIIVVDDGGAPAASAGGFPAPEAGAAPQETKVVRHEESRGRSEAANAGARAATNAFLAFLDDDDLFYPEHLSTLSNAARSQHAGWYSDAISAFLRPGESGAYETHKRLRIYGRDFDRELLLLDNYIPLPTLLVRRETFLDLGGFDPAFDLFEDWDFLIRLSQRGELLRIPRVTCEVRHFEGGSSVVLAAPEGSQRFRDAKLQVWQKHAALIDNDVVANVLERQKKRNGALYSEVIEAKGRADDVLRHVDRDARERLELQHTVNGYMLRVRELEGSVTALQALVPELEEKSAQVERLTRETADLRAANAGASDEIARLRVEIERLNNLLEMIYRSRTWKLHTTIEKIKGRG
jgi:LmbE family N-acetylglucosaminyl deacetylase/glycosyltransferase involved in cell wall biosynthesis